MACEFHHSRARLSQWLAGEKATREGSKSRRQQQEGQQRPASPFLSSSTRGGGASRAAHRSRSEVETYTRSLQLDIARRTAEAERLRLHADEVREKLHCFVAESGQAAAESEHMQTEIAGDLQRSLHSQSLQTARLQDAESQVAHMQREVRMLVSACAASKDSLLQHNQSLQALEAEISHERRDCMLLRQDIANCEEQERHIKDKLSHYRVSIATQESELNLLQLMAAEKSKEEACWERAVNYHQTSALRHVLRGLKLGVRQASIRIASAKKVLCSHRLVMARRFLQEWSAFTAFVAVVRHLTGKSSTLLRMDAYRSRLWHFIRMLELVVIRWRWTARRAKVQRQADAKLQFGRFIFQRWHQIVVHIQSIRQRIIFAQGRTARSLQLCWIREWRICLYKQRLLRRRVRKLQVARRWRALKWGIKLFSQRKRLGVLARIHWRVLLRRILLFQFVQILLTNWGFYARKSRVDRQLHAERALAEAKVRGIGLQTFINSFFAWQLMHREMTQDFLQSLQDITRHSQEKNVRRAICIMFAQVRESRISSLVWSRACAIRKQKACITWHGRCRECRHCRQVSAGVHKASIILSESSIRSALQKLIDRWLKKNQQTLLSKKVREGRHRIVRQRVLRCWLLASIRCARRSRDLHSIKGAVAVRDELLEHLRSECIQEYDLEQASVHISMDLQQRRESLYELQQEIGEDYSRRSAQRSRYHNAELSARTEAAAVAALHSQLQAGLAGDPQLDRFEADLLEVSQVQADLYSAIRNCEADHAANLQGLEIAEQTRDTLKEQLVFTSEQYASAEVTLNIELSRIQDEQDRLASCDQEQYNKQSCAKSTSK